MEYGYNLRRDIKRVTSASSGAPATLGIIQQSNK